MSAPLFTAAELAARLGGTLLGDGSITIEGPGDIAEPSSRAFVYAVGSAGYGRIYGQGFDLVLTDHEPAVVHGAVVVVPDPPHAYHELLRLYASRLRPSDDAGVHATAVIGADCDFPESISIAALCVIGKSVVFGESCIIRAGAVIGDGVVVGDGAVIGERAVIHSGVRMGNRVEIGPGSVIGGAGFGFDGDPERGWEPVPQLGGVRIGDDVSVGANCAIDRGTAGDTVIGSGSRLDNLVHIAHNVRLGANNLVVAQVGIAGSVVTGEGCVFGGQVGVADHCRIGDRVFIGSKSGVQRHGLKSDTRYWGNPARPMEESARIWAALRRLPDVLDSLQRDDRG